MIRRKRLRDPELYSRGQHDAMISTLWSHTFLSKWYMICSINKWAERSVRQSLNWVSYYDFFLHCWLQVLRPLKFSPANRAQAYASTSPQVKWMGKSAESMRCQILCVRLKVHSCYFRHWLGGDAIEASAYLVKLSFRNSDDWDTRSQCSAMQCGLDSDMRQVFSESVTHLNVGLSVKNPSSNYLHCFLWQYHS